MIKEFIVKNKDKKMILFCETKQDVKNFGAQTYANFLMLNGDMEQRARQNNIQQYRKDGTRSVLVATDVAARGLDIDDIDVVLHYQCRHVDSYVHRTGRTGRAGKEGWNVIFSEKSDLSFISSIESGLKTNIEYTNQITENTAD
jgi:superfamily II DNA/RNA helicase